LEKLGIYYLYVSRFSKFSITANKPSVETTIIVPLPEIFMLYKFFP
jgi:hypothetical protein